MIRIYCIKESFLWDETVKTFERYDVYYLSSYVKAFCIHGDGEPELLFYEADGLRAIYVYMKRKTIMNGVYDSITPYGYGGVLLEGDTNINKLQEFWDVYIKKMR